LGAHAATRQYHNFPKVNSIILRNLINEIQGLSKNNGVSNYF